MASNNKRHDIMIRSILLGIFGAMVSLSAMAQEVLAPFQVINDEHIGYIQSLDTDTLGRLYLADGAFATIRVYTSEGRFLYAIGRQGQGPGEFQTLAQAQIHQSMLYAYDFSPRRLSLFTLKGNVLDTRMIHSSPSGAFPMPTGDILCGARSFWITSTGPLLFLYGSAVSDPDQVTSGVLKVELRPVSEDGTPGAPWVVLPDRERYARTTERGWTIGTVPFGARPVITLTPSDDVVYGYTRTLELFLKPLEGKARLFFKAEVPRILVTDDMLRNYLSEEGKKEQTFAFFRKITPRYLPAFYDMVSDDSGNIWVAVNTPEAFAAGQTEYWVLSPTGQKIRTVRLDRVAYFYLIRDGIGYAITASPEGAYQIARYRLSE